MMASAVSSFGRSISFIVVAVALSSCSPAEKDASDAVREKDPPVRWKMTSTFSSSLTMLGTLGKRTERRIAEISGGNIEIKFYEPGALAPALEAFEAVSYGAIEAGWSTSGYWAGKVPALQLFSAVPFGPDAPEYLAWYRFGGGQELFEEIYHKRGIHGIICGITAPEAAGWFNKKIETIDDFSGLKVRFFGLGAKVMEKVGASAQLLSAGDIMPALELGTVDGAEFSMPAVDLDMGFWQVAKYYYFPGWHQQSTFYELMINLDAWNSLSVTQQHQINAVCGENIAYSIAEGEALQAPALKELEAKGVSIETYSAEILEALELAWNEVVAELVNDDEEFAEVWQSLSTFRASYTTWRELGYLKR